MNPHDHAVLIGIGRYGDAAATSKWISDLNGPDNDVEAVHGWLTRSDGGGLPAANVKRICSAEFPNPFADDGPKPDEPGVEQRLRELIDLPKALDERYAGRRLYVYVSGHGFSTKAEETALITAEATAGDRLNVLVTSWVGWLCEAARFQELVLWVDCCATIPREATVKPCDVPVRRRGNLPFPKRFYAFAAAVGDRAVEAEMADKTWHGAFTYALLQGLEGAAADRTGWALRDYLHNNVKTFMRPDQRTIGDVALEPAFGTTDPIEFGPPRPRPTFDVTLKLPAACVDKLATVSFDSSGPVAETTLTQPEWTVALEAGSYVVYVPETGFEEPFSVSGER